MVRLISRLATKFFLLILLSTPAFASIGSITDLRGAGNIKRAAKVMPAARGSGIEKNDTISTNSQGKFRITFVDQTTVNITENSRLVVDDFVFDGDKPKAGRLGLKLALGTARYASGGLGHGNPKGVNIRTPTATIGVRGTDFVMSVDEAGRTTVVLVPNCFDDKDVTKITFDCPAGAIDVITAAGVVSLDKPFQATVVENAFTPPAPPVTINPALKGMNNSIQIAPLATDDGQSLLKVAREAVKKYVNPSKAASDDNKDPALGTEDSADQVASATQTRAATPAELLAVYVDFNNALPKQTIYTEVSPTYYKLVQVGWVYSIISEDKLQAATVWLPKDTQVEVTVFQNGIGSGYNFMDHKWTSGGTGRPQGSITINQQGAPVP